MNAARIVGLHVASGFQAPPWRRCRSIKPVSLSNVGDQLTHATSPDPEHMATLAEQMRFQWVAAPILLVR